MHLILNSSIKQLENKWKTNGKQKDLRSIFNCILHIEIDSYQIGPIEH